MEHLIIRFLASACEDPRVEKVTNCEDDGLLLGWENTDSDSETSLRYQLIISLTFYVLLPYFPTFPIISDH